MYQKVYFMIHIFISDKNLRDEIIFKIECNNASR